MPAVTISEAAKACGFRSRSTLYRLRDEGQLAAYLTPPDATGRQLLELEPRGLPPLREHVARCVRPQINSPGRQRAPRRDGRWELLAQLLSDALGDAGQSLRLCDAEAEAIAAALPAAMAGSFGGPGLEQLRQGLTAAGCWRAGPIDDTAAARGWWGDDGWGRWEPGEPLEDAPFWQHVGSIVGGMLGGPFEQLSGPDAAELHRQIGEAIGSVEAGARWDAGRWAANSARLLLEDDDCQAGRCPHSRDELQRLADGGLLPPELQAQAAAALQRYQENDQQAPQALPVVVTD
jgi:hypothetical protein